MDAMNVIKRGVVSVGKGVFAFIHGFCRLLPKRDSIVLMSRQSNNPSLDFELLAKKIEERHPEYRVIVLSKELKNPLTYAFHMVRQTYHFATCKAVVLDSFCVTLGLIYPHIKVPVLQMWHALGLMKKAGYALLDKGAESRSSEDARLYGMHKGYSAVLVSSSYFAKEFAETFNVSEDKLVECPLPRVDALLSPEYRDVQRRRILEAYPQLEGKFNIVYCPTFRRVSAKNESRAMEALLNRIDFETANLIFQRHPVSAQRIDDERVLQDYDSGLNMLFIADAVISDYSTVIYEAGLLDVPVYLYTYDDEEYLDKRDLYFDLSCELPTVVTSDAEELMDAIYGNRFDHDAYAQFVRRYVAVPDEGSCCDRIVKTLWSLKR